MPLQQGDGGDGAGAVFPLSLKKPPMEGQDVRDIQWLLAGHNRYGHQTYLGEIDGVFGERTAEAARQMKYRIGYPDKACLPTAGRTLYTYLIPLESKEAKPRPESYIDRDRKRRAQSSYPLAVRGKIIGFPYQGTHTLGNWESDRACDIAAKEGTQVLACFDGVIGPQFGSLDSTNPRLAGLRLHLIGENDEGYYAHLESFAVGLKPGKHVGTGDVLGLSGSANGVEHLHFALKVGWPPSFLGVGDGQV